MKKLVLEKMPLGNGGGSIKTLQQVAEACKTAMTEIEVGSITLLNRPGNIGDTYYFHEEERWSLNALGLPNFGLEYYSQHLREMVKHAHGSGKKLRANIAPFTPTQCGLLADKCLHSGVDTVVINGSCPNVWDNGKQKAIPALDPIAAEAMFDRLKPYAGDFERIAFKLSPTDDLVLAAKLVEAFRTYKLNKLICCNTQGNSAGTRPNGKPALAFRAEEGAELLHVGGLAGKGVYEQSLSTVRTFAQYMPEAQIIGLGGIFDGTDVEMYLSAGCVGVQATTAFLKYGGRIFGEIYSHLTEKISA